MKDESQKNNFLSRIILVSMVLGIILTAVSAIAWEKQTEKHPHTIIVSTELDYPPYSYLDEKGNPTGYNVDITRSIAKVMGLNVDIKIGSWDDIRKALGSGKVDVISGMYYSEERVKLVDFSPPYTIVHHAIFAREGSPSIKSEDELRGKEIIVMRGDIMHDYVLENRLCGSPVLVATQADALKVLASGKHHYALIAKLPGLYWIKKLGLSKIVTVGPPIRPSKYCFAFLHSNSELLNRFSEGLAIIKETGQYKEIYDNWLGVLEPRGISTGVILKYMAMILIPMLLLLVGSVLWSQSLKRQVLRRTEDLEREINERKQGEEALRRSEEQLSNAMEIAHLGHWEYDVANDLFTFNDHFYSIFRTTAKQVGGYTMSSAEYARRFVHPDDMYVVEKETRKAIEATDPHFNQQLEHRILYGDGTAGYIVVRFFIVKDSQNRTVRTYGINQDITERKRLAEEREKLETQLRQAQKMEAIGTLAGGVAHDFNNILTTIIGNAGLALMGVGKDGTLREEIEEIKEAGERASALTRQLLAFSRKQIIQPKIVDLNELLTDIEKMLGRLIGEDVELLTIPDPELWQVEVDPGQMEQVIMNLTINARDAMPMGGKLVVETANVHMNENYFREHGIGGTPGFYVMLAISDTGSGMDKETREHIFEPFFTTKELGKGTGLGLSTVYGIAKQNNGFIWVYSEPGQGSTFKVYLPMVKGTVEAEEKERTFAAELGGSETVLIVEDDDSLRKFSRITLKQKGYKVIEAENGEDALRVNEDHDGSIDLLITDVVMPKMGGKEIAERLQPLYPQMKVIYMSGYTDDAIVHHGVLAPGLDFLEKPFTPEGLARKVREVLDRGN